MAGMMTKVRPPRFAPSRRLWSTEVCVVFYSNGCTLRFRQSKSKKMKSESVARSISTGRRHANRSLWVHYGYAPMRPLRCLDNNLRRPRLLGGQGNHRPSATIGKIAGWIISLPARQYSNKQRPLPCAVGIDTKEAAREIFRVLRGKVNPIEFDDP